MITKLPFCILCLFNCLIKLEEQFGKLINLHTVYDLNFEVFKLSPRGKKDRFFYLIMKFG